jgi:sulfide:quinone oxidoreductase
VGSGLAPKTAFRRRLDSVIPSHIGHIVQNAAGFEPGSNQVVLTDGSKVGYDYLIVASGLQISEWDSLAANS